MSILKTVKKPSVMMDVARYKIKWFYLCSLDNKDEREYLHTFITNLKKSGPVQMIVDNADDGIMSVYLYLFPDQRTYDKFVKENDYEDIEF